MKREEYPLKSIEARFERNEMVSPAVLCTVDAHINLSLLQCILITVLALPPTAPTNYTSFRTYSTGPSYSFLAFTRYQIKARINTLPNIKLAQFISAGVGFGFAGKNTNTTAMNKYPNATRLIGRPAQPSENLVAGKEPMPRVKRRCRSVAMTMR